MSKADPKSLQVTFRCGRAEEYARLAEAAKGLGVSPHILARDLVFMALDSGLAGALVPRPSPPPDELKRLIRTATEAIITALHPEMDEAAVARYCETVFDA
ncbi:MAG: hypothetical protein K2X87_22490 [Gemmataceae bacterium]|nr:hypothetical protein [Gemmataceae bacterium]